MGNEQQAGIGDRLIEEGTLTKDDLLMALSEGGLDGTDLAKAIESAKTVTREQLADFFEAASSTPKIADLREIPFASDASQLITEESAKRHLVVPLCKAGGIMFVVMGSNLDAYSVNELRAETKGPIKLVRGQAAQVKAAIDKVYQGVAEEIPAPDAETAVRVVEEQPPSAPPLVSNEKVAPEPVSEGPLEPVKVGREALEAALKDPHAKLVYEFDLTFLGTFDRSPAQRLQ